MFYRSVKSAIALAILAATAACGDATDDQRHPMKPQMQAGDGVEVTLTSVDVGENTGPDGIVPPASVGSTYVTATYTLKNASSGALSMEKWPQLKLQDGGGHKLDPEMFASTALSAAASPSWAETLNPGLSTQPKLVWRVAKASFDRQTWKITAAKPKITFALR